jgi:2-deoxy-D-gluconate 3-dehydrogenase
VSAFDLTGRVALVTGASRGIGLAIAGALAQAGADVIGASASLGQGDSAARRAVEGAGRSFTAVAVDFAQPQEAVRLAEALRRDGRTPDVLVNNAGTIRRAPAAEHPTEDWLHVLDVNLTAPFLLTREIGRDMLRRGHGKVIFTASMLSFQGGITVPGYTASKSAIAGLTKALANEWAPHGVNVNAIAPGYIETDNTSALRADAARSAAILERIPAGRWGRPDDVAGAAVFLASAAADYVHGAVLPVDGGWLAR